MAFTGVAALVAAETVTAAMVFAAVAEVGTVLSLVGAVTGDKDLSALGGVMSIGGIAGGFVSGLASAGDAAIAAATSGEAAAFESGFVGSEALTGGVDAAADAAGAAADSAAGAFEAGFQGTDALAHAAGGDLSGAATRAAGDISAAAPAQAPAANVGDSLTVNGPSAPAGPAGASAPTSPADVGGPVSSDSFFSDIWNGIKDPKNKNLVNGAMKIGGGLLQGAFAGDTADKDRALRERQVALNEQVGLGELALKQAQAANSNSQVKFPNGIINGARA